MIAASLENDRVAAERSSRYGEKVFGTKRFALKNRTPGTTSTAEIAQRGQADRVKVRGSSVLLHHRPAGLAQRERSLILPRGYRRLFSRSPSASFRDVYVK
jgi:hypothetical protein